MNINKTAMMIITGILLFFPFHDVEAGGRHSEVEEVAGETNSLAITYLEKLELGDGLFMPRFVGEKMTSEPESEVEKTALVAKIPEDRFRVALNHNGSSETCFASLDLQSNSCRIIKR
ncbi:hypothetical protein ACFL4G_01900 [Thermodesulfobacteriota bacterium]